MLNIASTKGWRGPHLCGSCPYTALPVTLLLIVTTGCKPNDVPTTPLLTVCIAASLEDVVDELIATYESDTNANIRLSTGASGTLRKQIELGAPCDVYVSADPIHVAALAKLNLIISNTHKILATNRLVLAQPAQSTKVITSPSALADSNLSVAMASPDSSPAGRYAKQALERLGIWTNIQNRLIFSDNVRMAAKQLSWRAISAAIVYATDVRADENISASFSFPQNSHDPIEYVGCVVTASRQADQARKIVHYLASRQAQATWRKHGFAVPDASENR